MDDCASAQARRRAPSVAYLPLHNSPCSLGCAAFVNDTHNTCMKVQCKVRLCMRSLREKRQRGAKVSLYMCLTEKNGGSSERRKSVQKKKRNREQTGPREPVSKRQRRIGGKPGCRTSTALVILAGLSWTMFAHLSF